MNCQDHAKLDDIVHLLKGKGKEIKMKLIGWDSYAMTVSAVIERLEKMIKEYEQGR